ncbi:MAG: tRNA 2-thiocytidine biosynthesis protein TtcA [Bacilli bacterium]|nr:tRNA 2-thiocytidine biosynthesis protein TtcA [Bacilli bacterium]
MSVISNQDIERSIIKKYRKKIWGPFCKALNDYQLVNNGDKIAVCISGGKDSLLLAKLLQECQKHYHITFTLEYIVMDPGFHQENRQTIIDNAAHLEFPIKIFNSNIFEVVALKAASFPCYLCARMRRGALYNYAQELGCNKIALGHHFNDVIETTMMNIMYAGTFKTMLPKLKATNYDGMELIRPMIYIKEADIITYTNNTGLKVMNCGCEVAAGKLASTRAQIKQFIKDYKLVFEDVDKAIFSAGTNVNLEAIMGYSLNGKKHSYLEHYDSNDIEEYLKEE